MKKMRSIHITISGIVQGVSFRAFTKRSADNLNIIGWVKNLPDGRVEALAVGEKKDIDAFIAQLKTGPHSSRVDNVETQEQSRAIPKNKYAGFDILRD